MYQKGLPSGWEGQHPTFVRPPYDAKAQLRIYGQHPGRDGKYFGGPNKPPLVFLPNRKDAVAGNLRPPKPKAATRPSVLQEFLTTTSIPGFEQLGRKQHVIGKIFWIFMFLGGLALAMYQSWGLMIEYFKYNTYQQSVLRLNISVMLPAITFCLKNPIRWQKAKQMNHTIVETAAVGAKFARNFNAVCMLWQWREGLKQICLRANDTSALMFDESPCMFRVSGREAIGGKVRCNLNPLVERYLWEESLLNGIREYWLQDLLEELDPVMLGLNSTLATCRLNIHAYCDPRDVIRFYHPYYAYCQTYNSGIRRPMIFTEPGKDVVLALFLDRTEEFEWLARTVGAVLYLHEPGTAPILSSPTIQNMYPGEWMKIGVTLSKVQRLPEPYPSKCISSDDPRYRLYTVYYTEETPYLYSYEACQTTCLQNRTMRTLECVNQKIPSLKSVDLKLCNVKDDDMYKGDEMNLQNCDCPPTCSETFYHTKVTFERGLMEFGYYQDAVKIQLGDVFRLINESSPAPEITMKQFSDNLAVVQLYFETATYDETEELPKYSVADFWGAVGGNIGFWTGISVLALMELVELFYLSIWRVICTLFARMRQRGSLRRNNNGKYFAGKPTAASYPVNSQFFPR